MPARHITQRYASCLEKDIQTIMIQGKYGIAFDLRETRSIEEIKQGLHKVLNKKFGDYYDKNWTNNRIRLELTTRNVFIENEDLTRELFNDLVVELEDRLYKEFNPTLIFAFYLDDYEYGSGFSLLETDTSNKRVWIDSVFNSSKNTGHEIPEEKFTHELREDIEMDGDEQRKIYYHNDYKYPIAGQRGIIEKVMRQILLNRFMFDYEWQEYKGDIKLLETDDFPIQDLQLLFGDS